MVLFLILLYSASYLALHYFIQNSSTHKSLLVWRLPTNDFHGGETALHYYPSGDQMGYINMSHSIQFPYNQIQTN
jgi:hypothetical protein